MTLGAALKGRDQDILGRGTFLHTLSNRLRERDNSWHLSEEDYLSVRLEWALQSVKRSDLIAAEFLEKQSGAGNNK